MLGDEIATQLAASGLGITLTSTGTPAYGIPFPPEAPDAAVCVIEYGGPPPLDAFGASLSAPAFERARFQVVVRDTSDHALTSRTLAENVKKSLRHFHGVISGTSYGFIKALGPVEFLKYDENHRMLFACNFEALKAESS